MGLDAAFCDLIGWWNGRRLQPALRAARLVIRDGYGWSEHLAAEPCRSDQEAVQYFRRAGALIALAWLLDATDLHCGNVIAHGPWPVLIDLETALHPRLPGESRNVLDTGLVPSWIAASSVGAVNAAIIAGNRPERRAAKLRRFWQAMSQSGLAPDAVADRLDLVEHMAGDEDRVPLLPQPVH